MVEIFCKGKCTGKRGKNPEQTTEPDVEESSKKGKGETSVISKQTKDRWDKKKKT